MRTVVFACVHNAGRSQMAAGFFNALAEPQRARALSAGTRPAAAVHPEVLEAMRERGIDLSAAQPRLLTSELMASAERVITMGCGEDCPFVPGVRLEDWPLRDPKGQSLDDVRKIRDEIRARVETLLAAEGWAAPGPAHAAAQIRPAEPQDRTGVLALLGQAELVTADVDPELHHYLVAGAAGDLIGAVGIEPLGRAGLLRSLVVAPAASRRGLGRALVLHAIESARAQGIDELFLLTRSASAFFAKLGFASVPRAEVPRAVQATGEYSQHCPASAEVMRLRLDGV